MGKLCFLTILLLFFFSLTEAVGELLPDSTKNNLFSVSFNSLDFVGYTGVPATRLSYVVSNYSGKPVKIMAPAGFLIVSTECTCNGDGPFGYSEITVNNPVTTVFVFLAGSNPQNYTNGNNQWVYAPTITDIYAGKVINQVAGEKDQIINVSGEIRENNGKINLSTPALNFVGYTSYASCTKAYRVGNATGKDIVIKAPENFAVYSDDDVYGNEPFKAGIPLGKEIISLRNNFTGNVYVIQKGQNAQSVGYGDYPALGTYYNSTTPGKYRGQLIHSVPGIPDEIINLSGEIFLGDYFSKIAINTAKTKPLQSFVRVAGRLTETNQFGNIAYLQDASGGISLKFDNSLQNYAIGDSVDCYAKVLKVDSAYVLSLTAADTIHIPLEVNPFLGNFSQVGKAATRFSRMSSLPKAVPPQIISVADLAKHEGQLVTLMNVYFLDSTSIYAKDGIYSVSDKLTSTNSLVKILSTTNLVGQSKLKGRVSITGIVKQTNSDYQLLPRFITDIVDSDPFMVSTTKITLSTTVGTAVTSDYKVTNTSGKPLTIMIPAGFAMNITVLVGGVATLLVKLATGQFILPAIYREATISVFLIGKNPSSQGLPTAVGTFQNIITHHIDGETDQIIEISGQIKAAFEISETKIEMSSIVGQPANSYFYTLTKNVSRAVTLKIPVGFALTIITTLPKPASFYEQILVTNQATLPENLVGTFYIYAYLQGQNPKFILRDSTTKNINNTIPIPTAAGLFSGKIIHSIDGQPDLSIDVSGVIQLPITKIVDVKILHDSSLVKISGRVSATNLGGYTYFQDETGGVPIDNQHLLEEAILGDSLEVTGKIMFLNQQRFLGNTTYSIIKLPRRNPMPKNISVAQLNDNEGNLVTISESSFQDKRFVFLPDFDYPITASSVTTQIRIWGTTNLIGDEKPQKSVKITGVVGRNNTIFKLYPRFKEDIPSAIAYKSDYVKPDNSTPSEKTLDIATWNTNWLSTTNQARIAAILQQTNAKDVLDSLNADLYVLQEVTSLTDFQSLLSQMKGYKGFCSSAISANNKNTDDSQHVCFIYRTSIIDSVGGKVLLKGVKDLPNYPADPSQFWSNGRLPYLFIANAMMNGVKRRLYVVGIHARENTAITADEQALQKKQRKYEAEVLKDSLDYYYGNVSIILAGDFNDDIVSTTTESSYKKYVDDTQNWFPVTRELSQKGYSTTLGQNQVIDHILISNEMKECYLDASSLSSYASGWVDVGLPFTFIRNYSSTTSRHLPVVARFRLQSITTATEKVNKNFVKIYPNPTKGGILLELNGLEYKDFSFELLNILGEKLAFAKGKWAEVGQPINQILEQANDGIYLLRVSDGHSFNQTLRVIKGK